MGFARERLLWTRRRLARPSFKPLRVVSGNVRHGRWWCREESGKALSNRTEAPASCSKLELACFFPATRSHAPHLPSLLPTPPIALPARPTPGRIHALATLGTLSAAGDVKLLDLPRAARHTYCARVPHAAAAYSRVFVGSARMTETKGSPGWCQPQQLTFWRYRIGPASTLSSPFIPRQHRTSAFVSVHNTGTESTTRLHMHSLPRSAAALHRALLSARMGLPAVSSRTRTTSATSPVGGAYPEP
uniref:Uncharacterized protein n=1 Tax=Mycena chlorophos TaxID=658473 RepID=A0ABQ0L9F4_MYCCL|nr:predicted protein [Mycena chlorophos]